VDFVSYHQYFYGATQLEATWDTYTDMPSMYAAEQDVSTGAFANYNKALAAVAAGQQPGGASTPIYITEYNTNWAFYQDCCRNNNTYAPLFNSLYATDMLDSVFNGSAREPSKIFYFAGSAYPYFCLIGVVDSNNDCLYSAGATPAPYPQYFPYQLIGSPQYLGLAAGGFMAKSISAPTGGGGLATTAFYTSNHDAFVITNPTSTAYNQITVTLANPGLTGTQGTLYQIVNGSQIETSPISFSVQGTSLSNGGLPTGRNPARRPSQLLRGIPRLAQVGPGWIGARYQGNFLRARPALQMLFASNCSVGTKEKFEPNQAVAIAGG
jgi:hypothetical protein